MSFDAHMNFAYSTVATAPSPATSGTSLVVQSGDGAKFPTPPFNATIWPINAKPTVANAEIVRVTNISTDTLTITRAQESSSARSVIIGDQIAAAITVKTITDIESPWANAVTQSKSGASTTSSGTYTDLTSNDGPAVTVTPGPTGSALVIVTAALANSGSQYNNVSVALSGGNTVAASDAYAYTVFGATFGQGSTTTLFQDLTQSSTVFTMKYDTTGGTLTAKNRTITVIPF